MLNKKLESKRMTSKN